MFKAVLYLSTLLSISNPNFTSGESYMENTDNTYIAESKATTLSSKTISLEDRFPDKYVNEVFKDNILLTLSYMSGAVKSKADIIWAQVEAPTRFDFTLKPGEVFAFHDQILPIHNKNVVKTTNAHFNFQDGFKSDGYLTGDGVCHLASLIYWASKDAGVDAEAPTNHNFAKINEVPKEYGVSIYNLPGAFETSARQNLYITNNLDKTLYYTFDYDGSNLTIKIIQSG